MFLSKCWQINLRVQRKRKRGSAIDSFANMVFICSVQNMFLGLKYLCMFETTLQTPSIFNLKTYLYSLYWYIQYIYLPWKFRNCSDQSRSDKWSDITTTKANPPSKISHFTSIWFSLSFQYSWVEYLYFTRVWFLFIQKKMLLFFKACSVIKSDYALTSRMWQQRLNRYWLNDVG